MHTAIYMFILSGIELILSSISSEQEKTTIGPFCPFSYLLFPVDTV